MLTEGKGPAIVQRQTEDIREADPDGRVVVHARIVDLLDGLVRRQAISPAMWNAGRHFQRDFRLAALVIMPASRLVRAPGGRGDVTLVQIGARRRVDSALAAVGGHGSLPACCVWYVLGEETSLADFALRQRWNGRTINRHMACGVLVAALAVLARHYGYDRA